EMQYLIDVSDIDVIITGFEIPEIDVILEEARAEQDEDDVVAIDTAAKAITRPGDVWQLGKHRVLCGSAIQESSLKQLMEDRRADVVFVDPPYNVAIDGNVCGKGSIHHREFAMASGEMAEDEFAAFLTEATRLLGRYSKASSVHFICMDWRHMGELIAAGARTYSDLLNLCVWVKNNGGMGSLYRSRHELVFVFRNGRG